MNRKLNYNDYRWRVRGFPFSPPWFITTPAASPLVTKIMATGFSPLGSSAYSSTTPKIAIMQPAIPVKDWRYYEKTIIAMEDGAGKLYKEYKDGETWRAQYKTWEDACVPLDKSRRQVDRIILKQVDGHADFLAKTTNRTECPNTPQEQKKQTLKTVAALPDPSKEEEPEKPQVRTADEVIAANAEQDTSPKDEALGWPIPQGCLDLWNKREEVQPLMTCASKLKCFLEDMVNQPLRGGLWAPLDGQVKTFFEGANRLYAYLEDCKPYAVCPNCDGTKSDAGKACPICNARGLVSRSMWTRNWSCMGFSDAEKQSFISKRQKNLKN